MTIATIKPHHTCCQCSASFQTGQQGYMLYAHLFCSNECLTTWTDIGFKSVEIQIDTEEGEA